MRLADGLPRIRGFRIARVLRHAFVHGCDNNRGFRICHFSVQGNHLHLICEARDATALARGVQGWKIRVTRRLNKQWHRRGTVWDDRYHATILRSPRQVRAGLCYVMQNARKHGLALPAWTGGVDPYSSAWYFDGWRDNSWRNGLSPPGNEAGLPGPPGPPVAKPRTWLLALGWRRCGLVSVDEGPGARRDRAT